MRRSPLRHPLAVLRNEIGLSQGELGELVNRTARTIQAIELRQMPLSEELAYAIAQATGVDPDWLRAGDPAQPPRSGNLAPGVARSEPYTKAVFEAHRAAVETTPGMNLDEWDKQLLAGVQQILAHTHAVIDGPLLRWKMYRTILTLAKEHKLNLTFSTTSTDGSTAFDPDEPPPLQLSYGVFDFDLPGTWRHTEDPQGHMFESPFGKLVVKRAQIGADILAEEERDPSSRAFLDALAPKWKEPDAQLTRPLVHDLQARLPCWTSEALARNGKLVIHSVVRLGADVLLALMYGPNVPETRESYSRFLKSICARSTSPTDSTPQAHAPPAATRPGGMEVRLTGPAGWKRQQSGSQRQWAGPRGETLVAFAGSMASRNTEEAVREMDAMVRGMAADYRPSGLPCWTSEKTDERDRNVLRIDSAIRISPAKALFIQFTAPNDEHSRRVYDEFLRNVRGRELSAPLESSENKPARGKRTEGEMLWFHAAG